MKFFKLMRPKLLQPLAFLLALAYTLTTVPSANAYEAVAFLFAGNTTTYIHYADRTGSRARTVCPDYFEINPDGSLLRTTKFDPSFVRAMHERGTRVTPYLSNNWDRVLGEKAVENRENFALEIAAAVEELNCDGVNLDIQNLTADWRDEFTDFVRLVRAAVPESKIVSVCVAPNPWGISTGWQGSYDYKALGEICEQVFIMAYDEHYSGGTAGAVASFKFVEDSVKYALKHVAANKIVLGVPFYGRYWREGAASGGQGITVSDVERLAANFKSELWYDSAAECARAKITVTASDNAVIWGWKALEPGVYDIWYENPRSLEKKLSLVRKYSLGGAGAWALGQEPEYFWNHYSDWLHGKVFSDIGGNWAQGYILNMVEVSAISGFPDGSFRPNEGLTRAQAAVLLARVTGVSAGTYSPARRGGFSDTVGYWAEREIDLMQQAGAFIGYTDGLFHPEKIITREEFSVICDRILYYPDTADFGERIYPDVSAKTNPWSNKAIILLSVNGIMNGFSDGYFRPQKPITRAEATKMLWLMLHFRGGFALGDISRGGRTLKAPGLIDPR